MAFTVASFPAGTAYAWFAPPQLTLTGIQGTLWSGRAAAGAVGDLALRDVRWDVRISRLLIGRLSALINAQLSDGGVSANVTVTPSRVALSDVRASTSLPTLRSVLPLSGTQGLANVALSKLEIDGGRLVEVVGDLKLAQLEVTPFSVTGGPRRLVPLGDYAVQFLESSGKGVNATFHDTGGPLEVTGTLVINDKRAYTLDGMVKPRPEASRELLDGLAIVTADPDAAGRRRLTLTGSL